MSTIVRRSQDWRIATTQLDLRHIPTGVPFRLKPRIVIDPIGGQTSRELAVYPSNLGSVTRVPSLKDIESLCDEAGVMGALLYGIAIDGSKKEG